MNISYITRFSVTTLLFLLICLPNIADAYKTTDQSSVRLNSNTVLHVVTYEFGFLNADLWMPIVANREAELDDKKPQLSFEFQESDGALAWDGVSHAVVLSSATIKDGFYYVPKGRRASFTLLVLHESLSEISNEHLQVTGLSGVIQKNTGQFLIKLSDEELSDYRTSEIE